jgi:Spy/CpxP family protein refolding chaperone
MKFLLILTILFSSLLLGDDDEYEKKDHHHYTKDLRYLDLSSSQKQQIKHILKNYRHEIKRYRKDKEDIQEQKQEIFSKETLDETKLEELNYRLTKISSKIEIDMLKAIHEVLSQEQRERFIKHMDDWEIE